MAPLPPRPQKGWETAEEQQGEGNITISWVACDGAEKRLVQWDQTTDGVVWN